MLLYLKWGEIGKRRERGRVQTYTNIPNAHTLKRFDYVALVI